MSVCSSSCLNILQKSLKGKKAIKADALPEQGSVVQGYVVNVGLKGCFMRLSSQITGRALIKDLADGFVENPMGLFHPGQLVKARVRQVDTETKQVQLSLRTSDVEGRGASSEDMKNIQDGDVLQGTVDRVAEIGVFVQLAGTNLVGLARKEQALQDSRKSLQEEYSIGDVVRAKVLRVSRDAGKISLGLTESFFRSSHSVQPLDLAMTAPAMVEEVVELTADPVPVEVVEEEIPEVVSKKEKNRKKKAKQAIEAVEEIQEEPAGKKRSLTAMQQVAAAPTKAQKMSHHVLADDDDELGPLQWDGAGQTQPLSVFGRQDDSDDSDDTSKEVDGKDGKTRGKKDMQRKKEEQLLREKERALAEGQLVPQQPEDFERLLMAEPNSSFLWVQYIAFYVSSADIEAARLLAQRALRSIHFRELQEKFNVWMAWLNLEYKYGSKEALEQTLKQAETESKVASPLVLLHC
jgi:rRNA biogenesis protein RRP5